MGREGSERRGLGNVVCELHVTHRAEALVMINSFMLKPLDCFHEIWKLSSSSAAREIGRTALVVPYLS